jgi:hypothetical protein
VDREETRRRKNMKGNAHAFATDPVD